VRTGPRSPVGSRCAVAEYFSCHEWQLGRNVAFDTALWLGAARGEADAAGMAAPQLGVADARLGMAAPQLGVADDARLPVVGVVMLGGWPRRAAGGADSEFAPRAEARAETEGGDEASAGVADGADDDDEEDDEAEDDEEEEEEE
jgi:hypothetical protein